MPNPFPGLRPFSQEESDYFFGRETISESVTTRVRVAPLTLMFARSGVGKSSFLNCRLVPYLRTESPVAYWNEWGSDRPERLIEAQLAELQQQPTLEERPILVLDQFEDVFKSPGQRTGLWDSLAELANVADSPAHILISMREEWLGAWHESEDYLPDALNCLLRLRPLSQGELVQAVLEPAEREGTVRFEPALASILVDDLKRPSAFGLEGLVVEPGLLQLVCRRLWAEAQRRELTIVTPALYEELEGADVIIRQFVWNELGSAGMATKEMPDPQMPKPRFSASERVLWSGLTRHVMAAQGVKAIVGAERLARTLLFEDMGVTGRAVAEDELPPWCTSYLERVPEKRDDPPIELVKWIEGVLVAAVDVGFMKRQRRLLVEDHLKKEASDGEEDLEQMPADVERDGAGVDLEEPREPAEEADSEEESRYIYELSHDSLADIFQVFKIEFEGWLRTKLAKLVGLLVATVVVFPLLVAVVIISGWESLAGFLLILVGVAVVGVIYAALFFVVTMFMTMIGRLIMHPIYRRLMKGRVPLRNLKSGR